MAPRVRRTLQVVGVLLAVVAGSVLYFTLTFGSADHTQFTLTAGEVARNRIAENATATLSDREAAAVDEAYRNAIGRTIADRLDVDGAYVERNGTYYRTYVESGPDVTRERPVLTTEQVADTGGEAVTSHRVRDGRRLKARRSVRYDELTI